MNMSSHWAGGWYFLLYVSGSELQQIISDSRSEIDSSSSDFWVMVAALKVCETKIESVETGYNVHKLDNVYVSENVFYHLTFIHIF